MTIAIRNLSKIPQTIILPRHLASRRMEMARATHSGKDGVVTKQNIRLVLPESRSILPGATEAGLPDELAHDEQVVKGQKAGVYEVTQETPAPEKPEPSKIKKAAEPPVESKKTKAGASGTN